jgi:hypothetical protein
MSNAAFSERVRAAGVHQARRRHVQTGRCPLDLDLPELPRIALGDNPAPAASERPATITSPCLRQEDSTCTRSIDRKLPVLPWNVACLSTGTTCPSISHAPTPALCSSNLSLPHSASEPSRAWAPCSHAVLAPPIPMPVCYLCPRKCVVKYRRPTSHTWPPTRGPPCRTPGGSS